MLSFFRRKNVSLNSLIVPDFGWKISKDNDTTRQWINPEQTIALSINFFDLPPDIPTMSDLEMLRKFYRDSISAVNGGLIQVDFLRIHNIPVAKTIFKLAQEHSGMTYLASLTIPFERCSFVIKLQCVEAGTTGMRDALIADQLLANGSIDIGDKGLENWFSDPYDNMYQSGTLMNLAEQETYDAMFPNHPLTQARNLIKQIETGLLFQPEIKHLQTFQK